MQSKHMKAMIISILLIGGLGTYIVISNTNETKKAEELEELEGYYTNRGEILALEIDTDTFNETGDVSDLTYRATERTEIRMNRWREISNAYPQIGFPEEDLDKEDWDAILTFFIDSVKDMTDVSSQIAEKAPDGNKPSLNNIEFFLLTGDVEEFVREEFEEKGITVD